MYYFSRYTGRTRCNWQRNMIRLRRSLYNINIVEKKMYAVYAGDWYVKRIDRVFSYVPSKNKRYCFILLVYKKTYIRYKRDEIHQWRLLLTFHVRHAFILFKPIRNFLNCRKSILNFRLSNNPRYQIYIYIYCTNQIGYFWILTKA